MLACLLMLLSFPLMPVAQENKLEQYSVRWTVPSKNASASMPCGGGDIGMNVWVEDGDLLIYFARSGSFDENNSLLKAGRIRIRLEPNVFRGNDFLQELHLERGYVTVSGKSNSVSASVKIWADVYTPVIHIDITGNKKIRATAAYESWRYRDRILKPKENFGNSWKWMAPTNNICRKDEVSFGDNAIWFYHHNTSKTIFDTTVSQQGLYSVKDQLYNPLQQLCSGGVFFGENFEADGTYEGVYTNTDFEGWRLRSRSPANRMSLVAVLGNVQTPDVNIWKRSVDSLRNTTVRRKPQDRKAEQWWRTFWDRSFVILPAADTASIAWQIGRNYQLFRYMLGCNALGSWPTKFNGGLFTVDPVFTDTASPFTPDFRNWGGGLHTMQNQRLVYFPMIKSGDWDALRAQFDFYLRILNNTELRTKVYWGHGGACFTEQMENYGLPDFAEYAGPSESRPPLLDKGVENNPWLEYLWDTVFEFCLMMLEEERYTQKNISAHIPFIESCLQFFDEHYRYLAAKRGSKLFDANGKYILFPGSAAETFKMATNASSTIAALQTVATRLLELPGSCLTGEKRKWLHEFLGRIPAISYQQFGSHTTIAPAQLWERINNVESPQLYPVYPWGIFGVGKPGLDTALNTWKYDTNVIRFRSHVGWKQDNIFAARLGLTGEAWRLTALKLQNAGRRFPAFWGPGFDWVPDHNWGGSGMIGMQEMLMQADGKRILLFPAWPMETDVHFKLHAPYNTTIEAELRKGKLVRLQVIPEERKKDIVVMSPSF